jgi:alkylation response protein AidB-like acyl-CoA dehydrogenase
MNFDLSEQENLLRDAVAGFLHERYDDTTMRAVANTPEGWRPKFWADYADTLDLFRLGVPESAGGLGGTRAEMVVVLEQIGRALPVEPFVDSVIVCGGLLSRAQTPVAAAALEDLMSGTALFAFAHNETQAPHGGSAVQTHAVHEGDAYRLHGGKSVVIAAPWADRLLVTAALHGGIGLFIVDTGAPGVVLHDYPTLDGRRAADIELHDVRVDQAALLAGPGEAEATVAFALDEAAAAVCAEAIGVLRKMLDLTLDYSGQRKQFGQAISEFQVTQHRLADMFIDLEQAASMALMAAAHLDDAAPVRALHVSAAKGYVGAACRRIAQACVQIHGAIGVTDELALGRYFKRAAAIQASFGSTNYHLGRYRRLKALQAVA